MNAHSFFLSRPQFDLAPAKLTAFENLLQSTPAGAFINYDLPFPKWQFLTYLCEIRELVLHGSQDQGIAMVEPRAARDIRAFSNQHAIYATTDGIWAIFFAILDRRKHTGMTLFNSCLRFRVSANQFSGPLYFFSVTQAALIQRPWCPGMVYILPRQAFTQEPPQKIQGTEVEFPHWIGTISSKPVARLQVEPQDFPFLAQIHGHDNGKLVELYTANPNGFPWPEALVT